MISRKLAAWCTAALLGTPSFAQLGAGWKEYTSDIRVHLDDAGGLKTYEWKPYIAACSNTNPCADYRYDSATSTETFRLLDDRTNRSEIRLHNDYRTGSRQFEGYVTFFPPLNDESFMQVFGSSSGATQLMVRGFSASGGSVRAQGELLVTNVYNKEFRLNVIHEQEDSGNRFRIYIDGVLKYQFADNERVSNYHKYGNYGSLRTSEAVVKIRDAKHFQSGQSPTGQVGINTLAPMDGGIRVVRSGGNLRIRARSEDPLRIDLLSASGRTLLARSLSGSLDYTVSLPADLAGAGVVRVRSGGAARPVMLAP